MKTTVRFENAVTKLYNAFHENRLNAYDCSACAVGNICNNNHEWSANFLATSIDFSIKSQITYPIKHEVKKLIKESGYTAYQLAKVEALFLNEVETYDRHNKEHQFKGLCAVIEYLCELDNIPNVMDIQSLFEFENDTPKKQLSEVLI